MKTIEVKTAHNITIQYHLATATDRILAFAIDGFILSIYVLLMSAIFHRNSFFLYLFSTVGAMLYHLLFEMFNNGQSIGKKLMRIKVISVRGQSPEKQEFLLRWIFRIIDITLTIGSCAILSIISNSKNQRIGDLLANTTVIKIILGQSHPLDSLQKLGTSSYEAKYPALKKFNDHDMLLVKESLNRMKKYPSVENQKMINTLSAELASVVGKDVKEIRNKDQFLTELLEDYILSTR